MESEANEVRRLAAIMFTDIVGYTALTQENEAAALSLLQEHASLLRPVFAANGGREVKMIGDSFFVEFSSTLSAVNCAVEIQRKLYERNVSRQGRRLELRIGIHVGDVVERGNDIFGDAVNIASRIEPLATPGSICVSQQVYDQVWNKVDHPLVGLGKRDLKNVQLPMEVYRVVLPWEKEAMGDESRRAVPLVDRVAELGQLRQAMERTSLGEGGLTFVAGEAGVGKTRLVEELIESSKGKNVTVMLGRCSRREGKTPYSPWIDQVREFVRASPPQLLFKVVGSYGAEVAKLVPEVTTMLGPVNSVSTGSPEQDRLRFIDGITQVVLRIANESPLLLVMDDMNWADGGSLDIMKSVARKAKENKVMLVGIYRDVEVEEDSDLFEFLYDVNREKLGSLVSLKGFGVEDTGKMLSALLNQAELDPEFRDLVYKKTEGNPFFIEELVRSLVEQGVVYRTARGWERKQVSEIEIPTGVRTVIKQRLSHLDPESQGVLAVASVTSCFSKEFSFSLLQSVTGIDEDKLVDLMERILKTKLVKEAKVDGKPGFCFVDTRVRDALYDEISQLRRGRYHLKTAQILEKTYGDELPEASGILAYHYLKASETKKCLEYSIMAAHESARVYAYSDGISYLKMALEVLESDPDDSVKRKVLEELADYSWSILKPDFGRPMEEAAKLYAAAGDRRHAADLYRKAAERLFDVNRENYSTPNDYFRRAGELLQNDGESVEMAYYLHSMARFLWLNGRAKEARPYVERSLPMAQRLGIPEVEAHSYLTMALLRAQGEGEGPSYERKALEIGLRENLFDVVNRAYNNLAVNAGTPREALEYSKAGLAYFEKVGYAPAVMNFKFNVATFSAQSGDLSNARKIFEEYKSSDVPAIRVECESSLSWLSIDQGRFEEAESHIVNLQRLMELSQDFQNVMQAKILQGYLSCEKGDLDRAAEQFKVARTFGEEKELGTGGSGLNAAVLQATLLTFMAEVAVLRGKKEEAREYQAESKTILTKFPRGDAELRFQEAEAALLEAEGDIAGAKREIESCVEGLRKLEVPTLLARALRYQASILAEGGDGEGAKKALEESAEIYDRLEAPVYAQRVRKTLAQIAENRLA